MKAADYHPNARFELIESALFYEARQTNLGSKFLIAVEACQRVVQEQPAIGSPFDTGTRRLMVKGFPFQLIYKNYDNVIFVVAVAHCGRKPGYWKRRLQTL